jgi:Tol biopolymer transport system component
MIGAPLLEAARRVKASLECFAMRSRTLAVVSLGWISLMMVVGCVATHRDAPVPTATSEITLTPSATYPPVETTQPLETETPESTPPVATVDCLELVDASDPGAGPLRIMYATDCVSTPDLGHVPTRLWLWNEETRASVALSLPPDALDPKPSSDFSRIVFLRAIGDGIQELWVIDQDGSHERRLLQISLDQVRQRNPMARAIDTQYGWVQDTHTVFIQMRPLLFNLELAPFDTLVLVDVITGQLTTLTPPGDVYTRLFSPDGSKAALLASDQVSFADTRDGEVQFAIPLPLAYEEYPGLRLENLLGFSPDGRFLTAFVRGGLVIVDTTAGSQREFEIDYKAFGIGDWIPYVAPIEWRDNSTLLLLAGHPAAEEQRLDVFVELTDWEFSLYLLDAHEATSERIQTFRGVYPSAILSPDLKLLAYERMSQDGGTRQLYLVDLESGTETLYVSDSEDPIIPGSGSAQYANWGPDSRLFFFAAYIEGDYRAYLGQLGSEPIPFEVKASSVKWIDGERFLARPASSDLELHLYTIHGDDALIAKIQPTE